MNIWIAIIKNDNSASRFFHYACNDDEAVEAFYALSQLEGIIPALESAHAVAYAMKLAKTLPSDQTILVNLSGRGDKDIDYVIEHYPVPNAKF